MFGRSELSHPSRVIHLVLELQGGAIIHDEVYNLKKIITNFHIIFLLILNYIKIDDYKKTF